MKIRNFGSKTLTWIKERLLVLSTERCFTSASESALPLTKKTLSVLAGTPISKLSGKLFAFTSPSTSAIIPSK